MQKGAATVEVRVDIHGTAWSVCARARGWVGVGEWHVLRKFCPQRRWKQHTHGLKRIQRCQTPSTIHNHLGSAQSPSSNSLAGLNIAKHHGGWLSVMRYIYRDIYIFTSVWQQASLQKISFTNCTRGAVPVDSCVECSRKCWWWRRRCSAFRKPPSYHTALSKRGSRQNVQLVQFALLSTRYRWYTVVIIVSSAHRCQSNVLDVMWACHLDDRSHCSLRLQYKFLNNLRHPIYYRERECLNTTHTKGVSDSDWAWNTKWAWIRIPWIRVFNPGITGKCTSYP